MISTEKQYGGNRFQNDDIESQSKSDFKGLKHLKLQKTNLQPVLVINRAFMLGLSGPFLQLSQHLITPSFIDYKGMFTPRTTTITIII